MAHITNFLSLVMLVRFVDCVETKKTDFIEVTNKFLKYLLKLKLLVFESKSYEFQ